MSPLEMYMEFIIDKLKEEQKKTEDRLEVRPENPIDFVLEGRLGVYKSLVSTIERDLNFLRQEILVDDSTD